MTTITYAARVIPLVLSGWLCASQAAADINPLSTRQCEHMQGPGIITADNPVSCDRLRVVSFTYWEFSGQSNALGEVMVLDVLSSHVQALFDDLFEQGFPLGNAVLVQDCPSNDPGCHNNTFAFNGHRPAANGSWSGHAYGAAIDLNPMSNPSVKIGDSGQMRLHPEESSRQSLNRTKYRPGYATRAGLAEEVVDVFARHGFFNWGGYRDVPTGFQHFSIGSKAFMQVLANVAPPEAQKAIDRRVVEYRQCMAASTLIPHEAARKSCVETVMKSSL